MVRHIRYAHDSSYQNNVIYRLSHHVIARLQEKIPILFIIVGRIYTVNFSAI